MTLFSLAIARPQEYSQSQSSLRTDQDQQDTRTVHVIAIVRDDRVHPQNGKYSLDFETEDGIVRSESGGPLEHLEGTPTGQQGEIS